MNNPSYVCDACPQPTTLLEKKYFFPRPYDLPDPDSYLWRYLDFTKYVSLLSTGSLFFARADTFDDAFEGAKGIADNKKGWDDHFGKFFRDAICNPPDGRQVTLDEEAIGKQVASLMEQLSSGGEQQRRQVFISCWHENAHESEAMWRLYSSFLPNAVAIRTTPQRMYRALGRDPFIAIGRVQYIDFNKRYAGVNDSFWRKRLSYEHEKEVRALIQDFHTEDAGILKPCDLGELIESVHVSPKAQDWFIRLVADINTRYGLNVGVNPSELLKAPFF